MKKIISVLLLALLLLAAVSCGAEAPDGMQLASSKNAAYSLYVPKSWTLGATSEYASAYYSSDDQSNVSVFFFTPEKSMTLEEYWADFEAEYKSAFPTMKLESNEETTLDGKKAGKYVFTATVSEKEYKFAQYIAEAGGSIYILTYTAPAENYDLHTAEVESIADNFRFK